MQEGQKSQKAQETDVICLTEIKETARKLLPRDSMLRVLILSEPDFLPRQIGLAKLEVFAQLLYPGIRNLMVVEYVNGWEK
jgi:hypothetical protein